MVVMTLVAMSFGLGAAAATEAAMPRARPPWPSRRGRAGKSLAVGGDLGDAAESGVAQHAHHQVAAFRHPAIFGGNRRLLDPVLQTLDGFVVPLVGLGKERLQVGGIGCGDAARNSQCGSRGSQKSAAIQIREFH